MKEFDNLATALQVGVRRANPDRLPLLKEWTCGSPEKACLIDLGVLDLMRRAGMTPRDDLAPVDGAPPETRRYALASVEPLLEALDLEAVQAILEWAEVAAGMELLAAPAVLVRFLELPPKTRTALLPVFGERAHWLADLMGIRLRPPEPAEPATWEDLGWRERAERIQAAEKSPENLPLFEAAATEKRKEVRDEAFRTLAQIPGSSVATTILELAMGRLTVVRKLLSKELKVSPPTPEELPPQMPRTAAFGTLGPNALALYDLVRHTPPSFWEQETGLQPGDLIALAEKSDYAEALISGWLRAIPHNFVEPRWSDALLLARVDVNRPQFRETLCQHASEAAFEEAVLGRRFHPDAVFAYAMARGKRLSPAVSELLVDFIKQRHSISKAWPAYHLDLSAIRFVSEPWPDESESTRQHLFRVIELRLRLHRSL